MSFSSRAYLAYEELRLQEPVRGTHRSKWHKSKWEQHAKIVLPPPDLRTEAELEELETEYLKQFGI